jgi:hypothetical protein
VVRLFNNLEISNGKNITTICKGINLLVIRLVETKKMILVKYQHHKYQKNKEEQLCHIKFHPTIPKLELYIIYMEYVQQVVVLKKERESKERAIKNFVRPVKI